MNTRIEAIARRTKIVLIEANPLVAAGVCNSLAKHIDCAVLSRSTLNDQVASSASLFIIDEATAGTSLYRLINLICQWAPDHRCVLLGERFTIERIFSLMAAGIRGFLTYGRVSKDVNRCIECVLDGRLWLDRHQLEQVCLYMQHLWSKKHSALRFTRRQQQVVDLLQRRLSNKQIAAQLEISENTVKFHIGKLFMKMGVHTRHSIKDALEPTGT